VKQYSQSWHLIPAANTSLKENEMVNMAPETSEKPQAVSFPVTNDGSTKSHVMRVKNGTRVAARSTYTTTPDKISDRTFPESALSKRVLDALTEDIDPAKSLADIRRVLVGPTRQLHEARMEEVLQILEESDKATAVALQGLESQLNSLAAVTERQAVGMEETNQRIERQAEHLNAEIERSRKSSHDMLSELFLVFDSKLEKAITQLTQQVGQMESQSTQLSQRIDDVANHTSDSIQTMASDFAGRLQDLSAATVANDERIIDQFESRLGRAEVYADKENRRHLAAFADGFSELADRFLALRNPPAN
jgi:Zn-dependent metalloprotease